MNTSDIIMTTTDIINLYKLNIIKFYIKLIGYNPYSTHFNIMPAKIIPPAQSFSMSLTRRASHLRVTNFAETYRDYLL